MDGPHANQHTHQVDEPVPEPTKGVVRVKVKAASLNPIDYKMPKMSLGKFVGCDVAGVVDAVHPSVTEFAPGDEVFGVAQFGKSGAIAEYCLCEAKMLARKPKDLPFTKAAGAVVSYITSYGALVDKTKGGMMAGDAVLVIGASGGCGLAAVQLAKALGASEIVGVCSSNNFELVLNAGATRCVDYKDPTAYAAMLNTDKFDVIYDTATAADWRGLDSNASTNYWPDGAKMLKAGKRSRHVSSSGTYWQWFLTIFGLSGKHKVVFMDLSKVRADLEEICRLLGGGIDTHLGLVSPMTAQGLSAALDKIRSRRAQGKVVISMEESDGSPPVKTVSAQGE